VFVIKRIFTPYCSNLVWKLVWCHSGFLSLSNSFWMKLFPGANRTSHEIRIILHRALWWHGERGCVHGSWDRAFMQIESYSVTYLSLLKYQTTASCSNQTKNFLSTIARPFFITYKHMTAQIRNVRMKINRFSPDFSSWILVKYMDFSNKHVIIIM
jgi:hypothetical protein